MIRSMPKCIHNLCLYVIIRSQSFSHNSPASLKGFVRNILFFHHGNSRRPAAGLNLLRNSSKNAFPGLSPSSSSSPFRNDEKGHRPDRQNAEPRSHKDRGSSRFGSTGRPQDRRFFPGRRRASATVGASGQACLGYRPRRSLRTL